MERISISVPASRKSFLLELLRSFSYVKVEEEKPEVIISKAHKKVLHKRLKSVKENRHKLVSEKDMDKRIRKVL
ncbi:MAG: hypothetical protein ACOZCO_14970 [Bacteroidota bacterium]